MRSPIDALREARTALGDAPTRRRKARDAARTLRSFGDRAEQRRRLRRLREKGLLKEAPNPWQVGVGTWRMFIDFVLPMSRALYRESGKSFAWQQVLRFLDEPSAVMDPVGLSAPMEMITSHLLQVVHHEAAYDVQLLEMFPGGVTDLLRQARALAEGRHPRQAAIDAIVEKPDYHRRLVAALERYIDDPAQAWRLVVYPPFEGVDEKIVAIGERFATPARFLAYAAKMPPTPGAAVRALARGTRRGA
ncbi:MAG: hypothetical protein KC466_11610 [Myxococcales bacterium]|nr:hypothetical protein [Myxococcales bacterium]